MMIDLRDSPPTPTPLLGEGAARDSKELSPSRRGADPAQTSPTAPRPLPERSTTGVYHIPGNQAQETREAVCRRTSRYEIFLTFRGNPLRYVHYALPS